MEKGTVNPEPAARGYGGRGGGSRKLFKKKVFGGPVSFIGATGSPCFGFLVMSPLGFKARVGSALFAFFVEVNLTFIY